MPVSDCLAPQLVLRIWSFPRPLVLFPAQPSVLTLQRTALASARQVWLDGFSELYGRRSGLRFRAVRKQPRHGQDRRHQKRDQDKRDEESPSLPPDSHTAEAYEDYSAFSLHCVKAPGNARYNYWVLEAPLSSLALHRRQDQRPGSKTEPRLTQRQLPRRSVDSAVPRFPQC